MILCGLSHQRLNHQDASNARQISIPERFPGARSYLWTQYHRSNPLNELYWIDQTDDDLVVLEPAAIKVQRGVSSPILNTEPAPDPYNLDHYLLTSSEGFSPFEQNLGQAPFHDLRGEDVWPALAFTEDGGVHPGKVVSLSCTID